MNEFCYTRCIPTVNPEIIYRPAWLQRVSKNSAKAKGWRRCGIACVFKIAKEVRHWPEARPPFLDSSPKSPDMLSSEDVLSLGSTV